MRKLFAVLVCLFAVSAAAQEAIPDGEIADRLAHLLDAIAPHPQPPIAPQTHECFFHTTLGCNTTVNESINIFGCVTSDGLTYFNAYRFFVNANTTVTFSFRMTPYTPLILLTDDNATTTLASSVGSVAGSTVTISYKTTSSAYLLLAVSPLERFATGSYTLTMTCTTAPASNCTPNATTMCLNNDRFAVSAAWRTTGGQTGNGTATKLTSDTGYFTFFSSTNVEVVIKVLDACGLNSRYWIFAGGLTDVNVTLTVRDTKTGTTRTYANPLGVAFQPIQDTSALATCP